MPRASLSAQTIVPAPIDAVFPYVADLTRHGEWSANPLTVAALEAGPPRVGGRYRSTAAVGRLSFTADLTLTALDPPHRIAFRGRDETGAFEHVFRMTPVGDGTRVERHATFDLTVGQWLFFLLTYFPVRRPAMRRALARLADRLA